ncbi:beta-1,3-galactosyltransferase 5-like [Bacillus rossius redtenbacheri]|uniref:beta-1,3-galactosyltransferase 5-like n=1 Tax=Bacillus rossius redtenbacheri TaxID=93214 RepID=UPI002FDEF9F6
MADNYRWLRYALAGLAAVMLVYLVLVANSGANLAKPEPGMRRFLQLQEEATSSAQDASVANVSSTATTAATTTTTPKVAVDNTSMRYMHRPGYVVENAGLCRGNGSQLRVLILVTSAPDHGRHRMAIRFTWGHFSLRKDVAVGFFLGAVEGDDARQKAVLEEADLYGDVVQSRNADGYRRLPLKTLSLLQWVDAHCAGARFVLKTDDDMFINVEELLRFVRDHADARDTIFGLLARGWKPIRSPDNKYHVTLEQFPEPVLPDFTTGPAYLLTGDLVRRMHEAALRRRFVPLEDVLFTGLVAGDVGARRVHSPLFHSVGLGRSRADECKRRASISVHDVPYEQQFALWGQLLDGKHAC